MFNIIRTINSNIFYAIYILTGYHEHGSAGIEMLFRPVPGRDKAYPGRDRDRYRDENEIPAGTGIRLIPAGTGPVPVFFEYL